MLAIFKREVLSFFTTPVGYLIIGFFLVLNGLFLWVFKGNFNIFDYGFADLGNFFLLTPWVFLFLIPAVTMKSFSEEKKAGTLELLFIKPLSIRETVYGKFFGALFLVLIALVPTILYGICISQLAIPEGNLDWGLIYGSYFGLFFLAMSYTAIGIFRTDKAGNRQVIHLVACLDQLRRVTVFTNERTNDRVGESRPQIEGLPGQHGDHRGRRALVCSDMIAEKSEATELRGEAGVLLEYLPDDI